MAISQHDHVTRLVESPIAADVRRGLSSQPKTLPPKYFYDDVGSELFDQICELPEYYLTRAERGLLERHAVDIIEAASAVSLIELGSGMARKTSPLLGAMADRLDPSSTRARWVPFDISKAALNASAQAMKVQHPRIVVQGVVGEFPGDLSRLRSIGLDEGARLFAFLGSTIGNLDEDEAPALIRAIAELMTADDWFLLGVDLVKDEGVLHRAYNDAAGVTARFNLNVLAVLNRELGGNFELSRFRHRAHYEPKRARIEMFLDSTIAQTIHLRARSIDMHVSFAEGESIRTEISRKFTRASTDLTLCQGGMSLERWLVADDGAFALALARKVQSA